MEAFDCLKLENQLCFPLYACSKEIVRRYKPFLDELDLTYTQYITLLVLWENDDTAPCDPMNIRVLGSKLYLDSGTLTPLIKKLEQKDLIEKRRDPKDERSVMINLTEKGRSLKEQAAKVPGQMGGCIELPKEDAKELRRILGELLDILSQE